jgi:DNA-binding LacI/PurR family transcriptional regulator
LPEELEALSNGGSARRKQPVLAIGAKAPTSGNVNAIDVDNIELARKGAEHLLDLGHVHIGYIGGADSLSNTVDRWEGFVQSCAARGLTNTDTPVIRARSWKLEEPQKAQLARLLRGAERPTAIFAAGYFYALDVYSAAAAAGLKIPTDLSIVAVDDPPSSSFLAPPLTTLRQPLIQLGTEAFTILANQIRAKESEQVTRTLAAELIVRQSTGAPNGAALSSMASASHAH